MTPQERDAALKLVAKPEFWCRARLFIALRSAQLSGVLGEVLDEIQLDETAQDLIADHLALYWGGIKVGDRVRSYDFPGSRADCYVIGVVEGFTEREGCQRYVIRGETYVIRGEAEPIPDGQRFYPPVNGTPSLMGGRTFGVIAEEHAQVLAQIRRQS